jgi:MFS family permease
VTRRLPLALVAGLVLADSSIVTLALPDVLRDLDTSVGGVAWVLVAFNLALALAAIPAALLVRRRAPAALAVAILVFALACLACAAAGSLGVLVGARVAQGVAGAVVVVAALELLVADDGRRGLGTWVTAGVIGAAVGPAAGGLLTQAFSWEAMFGLQAPVALVGLSALVRAAAAGPAPTAAPQPPARPAPAALAALALGSAGLAAALFLLVTMLIEGWRHSPAAAAATVTAMPAAALLAPLAVRRLAERERAAAGTVLLAGGLAALGLLPGATPAWTLAPQVLAGAGLGLLVPALTHAAIPPGGRVEPAASITIAARHAGVVLGLLALTPLFTADLNAQRDRTERAGLADLLDAPLPLTTKLDLARSLADVVANADGRLPDLEPAFRDVDVPAQDRAELDDLHAQLDDQLDRAGTAAFSRSFLAAAGFALLALLPVAVLRRRA